MNPTTAVTGYTPPPIDLETLRAGTLWRYKDYAYLVERVTFEEQVRVRHRVDLTPYVEGYGPAEVDVRMTRAWWLDPHVKDMPPLDGWIGTGGVHIAGLGWYMIRSIGEHISSFSEFGPRDPEDIPTDWQWRFARHPDTDRTALMAGTDVTVVVEGRLSASWLDGQGVALVGAGTPVVIPPALVTSVRERR